MKKYLFNKIEFADSVKFIPYRKATLGESFMANTQTSCNQEKWTFKPYSLKDFLKMLSKTKLNEENEYDIFLDLGIVPTRKEPISFDKALKIFVTDIYRDKVPNKIVLAKFYQKAYQIRQAARKDKEILNKEPRDYLK